MRRTARFPGSALLLTAVVLVTLAGVALLAWDPRPATSRSFDRGVNGLWLGHRFYTGVGVRDGEPVTPEEVDTLVDTLARRGFRYVFIHAGPVQPDGSIEDEPDLVLATLARRAPNVQRLAWLGARVEKIDLTQAAFRRGLIETIRKLRGAGFSGVHFDFEPLRDGHPGYLETLEAVREAFGPEFSISQATPRAGPFGFSFGPLRGSFWSESFYRDTIERTDQTVVMAYDTGLAFTLNWRRRADLLGSAGREHPDRVRGRSRRARGARIRLLPGGRVGLRVLGDGRRRVGRVRPVLEAAGGVTRRLVVTPSGPAPAPAAHDRAAAAPRTAC